MNPDDLERRLSRTPRSGPPPGWRVEILAAAQAARAESAVRPAMASSMERSRPAEAAEYRTGWDVFRGLWAAVRRSPWSLLAGGWMVVAVLQHADGWIERDRGAGDGGAVAAAGSRAEILAAARVYRAEVVALVAREEGNGEAGAERRTEPASGPAGPASDGPPRGQWLPGRREFAAPVGRTWA